jgi:copper chaperone CopZ
MACNLKNMESIKVVNIKCGGCSAMIMNSLEKAGLGNISVDVENQTVNFDGDKEIAKKTLLKIGYPEFDSKEGKSFLKKAQSYVSCMIGRVNKK